MKKLRWLSLVLVLAILLCAGCGNSAGKATTAEESNPGAGLVTAISPVGEVDTVNDSIRLFIDRAHQRYSTDDTSFTVKNNDEMDTLVSTARFAWEIKEGVAVKSAAVQYGEDPDFNDFNEVERKRSDTNSVAVANLKTGATYYWRVALTLEEGETVYSDTFTFETKAGPRILSVNGVKNVRDLGGWTTEDGEVIPCGRIFRSANLDHPEEDGRQYLLEELGIKTEIDFRNPEKESLKPVFADTLNYYNISIFSYANFLKDKFNAAKVLRIFTKPENYPIDFHCAGGADRAGTVAFLLNALCGVNEIDLICDYELTNGRFRNGTSGDSYFKFPELLQAFHLRPGETTREKARYFCINECGLSEMEVANIVALRMKDHGVYVDPPQKAIAVRDGKISAEIDLRSSTTVSSVTDEKGAVLPFTFENGVLTVTVSGEGAGTITFDDGGTLPIQWA